ncbi:MAG: modification methylase, partial [Kiritimatiellae bacterium]|nr:modification methylase [Kiritimatiellia bacterium]
VAQLIEYNKKFLIIGSQNAVTYKEIFALLKADKIWLGNKCGDMSFKVPHYFSPRATRYWQDLDGQKWRSLGNICWFTNLDHAKRHEDLILYKHYTPEEYPEYDNYDAIEVGKNVNIPVDYKGKMGVPITFLTVYNPKQFTIIGLDRYVEDNPNYGKRFTINGKETYARILIQKRNTLVEE